MEPGVASVPAGAPPSPAARPPGRWAALLNLLANQAVWLLCIVGAARGSAAWGLAAAAALVLLHLLGARARWRREALLVLAAMGLGGLFDTVWLALGGVSYTSGQVHPALTPAWMLALWAAFATSLNLSMRWMQARPVWAAVLGALGGLLSYRAGVALGAAEVAEGWVGWGLLALGWAVLMPLVCRVAAWAGGPAQAAGKAPA